MQRYREAAGRTDNSYISFFFIQVIVEEITYEILSRCYTVKLVTSDARLDGKYMTG